MIGALVVVGGPYFLWSTSAALHADRKVKSSRR